MSDLEALTGTLGSLAPAFLLLLPSRLRGAACQLPDGMHHALLEEVLAENARQLVHEDLRQLQGLGHGGSVFLRQQASNEAGDGQVSQLPPQGCWLTEVEDLGDSGEALGAHLHVMQ